MELRRVDHDRIARLREQRGGTPALGIRPVFYSRLVTEAEPYEIRQLSAASGGDAVLGYVLLLDRPHDGHSHVAAVENPEAGRPGVGQITTEELQSLMAGGKHFRLIDVLGEEHWRQGHLPGSEWVDFKSLAREARVRFKPEEPIVVYCNGFT